MARPEAYAKPRHDRRRAAPNPSRPAQDATSAQDPGFMGVIREPFSGAWQMNKECNAQTALAFSGVYACVSTIADDVSKLPMRVRERDDRGIAYDRPDHWAARLFRRPNAFQTGLQFVQQYKTCKLLTGNVYVVFKYDDRQVPNEMHIVDPRTVTPFVTPEGSVYYRINQARSNSNALARLKESDYLFPASEVLHDRMTSVFHPLIGISPLFAAGASASAGYSIVQNSKAFFQNMARASGVLTAPGRVSRETAERLAGKWKENYSGGNTGNVAVLGDGLKWEPLSMTATDAQLIEQLRWSVEDVARVFRVPLFMLGDLSKVSYRNSEQLTRVYYQSTLQWHLESMEAAFDKFFGFTARTFLEFDLDSLFRTDADTRFKAYQSALAAGWTAINEVRAQENLPPVEGGEEPRVQMQYVPLSLANEPPAPEPVEETPPDEDDPDAEEAPEETDEPEAEEMAMSPEQLATLESLKRGFEEVKAENVSLKAELSELRKLAANAQTVADVAHAETELIRHLWTTQNRQLADLTTALATRAPAPVQAPAHAPAREEGGPNAD